MNDVNDGPTGAQQRARRGEGAPTMWPETIQWAVRQAQGEQPGVAEGMAAQWRSQDSALKTAIAGIKAALASIRFESPTASTALHRKVAELNDALDGGSRTANGMAAALDPALSSAQSEFQIEMEELHDEYEQVRAKAETYERIENLYKHNDTPIGMWVALEREGLGWTWTQDTESVDEEYNQRALELAQRYEDEYAPAISLMSSSRPPQLEPADFIVHPGVLGVDIPPNLAGGPPPPAAPPSVPPAFSGVPPRAALPPTAPGSGHGRTGAPTFAAPNGRGGPAPTFAGGQGGLDQSTTGPTPNGSATAGTQGGSPVPALPMGSLIGAPGATGSGQHDGTSGITGAADGTGNTGAPEFPDAGVGAPGSGAGSGTPGQLPQLADVGQGATGPTTTGATPVPPSFTGLMPPAFHPAPGISPPAMPVVAAPPAPSLTRNMVEAPNPPSAAPPNPPVRVPPSNIVDPPRPTGEPVDPLPPSRSMPVDLTELPPGTIIPPSVGIPPAASNPQQQGNTVTNRHARQAPQNGTLAPTTPEAFTPSAGASPILGAGRKRTRPGSSTEAPSAVEAAGAASPVLSNPHQTEPTKTYTERRKEAEQKHRAERTKAKERRNSQFAADVEAGITAVFEGRAAADAPTENRSTEIPAALTPATPGAARPTKRTRASTHADRTPRRTAAEPTVSQEQPTALSDQMAWEVETPGGPVVSAETKETKRPNEPPPTLAAGS